MTQIHKFCIFYLMAFPVLRCQSIKMERGWDGKASNITLNWTWGQDNSSMQKMLDAVEKNSVSMKDLQTAVGHIKLGCSSISMKELVEAIIGIIKIRARQLQRHLDEIKDDLKNENREQQNVIRWLKEIKERAVYQPIPGKQTTPKPNDQESCANYLRDGADSGVYTLHLTNPVNNITVYCMEDPDGGDAWTLIQRRTSKTFNMDHRWEQYNNGFGDIAGDHWLGLKNVYRILQTQSGSADLWILLRIGAQERYAKYNFFSLGDVGSSYTLKTVGQYKGNHSNRLSNVVGQKFATKDKNAGRCSKNSGWWYNHRNKCTAGWNEKGSFWPPKAFTYIHMAIRTF